MIRNAAGIAFRKSLDSGIDWKKEKRKYNRVKRDVTVTILIGQTISKGQSETLKLRGHGRVKV